MLSFPSRVSPQRVPAPSARCMEAALSLVEADETDWEALAGLALTDPAWTCHLFLARPGDPHAPATDLKAALRERLQDLGRDLLQVWLWQAVAVGAAAPLPAWLMAAELARHLARETAYPCPDEAYLAALWHGLGEQMAGPGAPAAPETWPADGLTSLSADHASIASRLAEACGLPEVVADALLIHHILAEHLAGAHPLVRLLHVATTLCRPEATTQFPRLAALVGLPEARLQALADDLSRLLGSVDAAATVPAIASTPALPTWVTRLRRTAGEGLLRSAFDTLDAAHTLARLQLAAGLLHGQRLVVFAEQRGDTLHALPLPGGAHLAARFDQLGLRADDPTSMLALALRSATPTHHRARQESRARSPADWHLVRWTDAPGLLCIPAAAQAAVAVLILHEGDAETPQPELHQLVGHAAARIHGLRLQDEALHAREEATARRYHEHARRLAHEAGNPISIMRTYLELIADAHPNDQALRQQMQLLDQEVERIDGLVQRFGQPPQEEAERPWCQATDVLREMQRLHGEVLFAHRGIQFDVRCHAQLPPVAVPASVLKQILLNLFRNASEALHPGGKFSVATSGILSVDGCRCLELRLVDNGPGLRAARLAKLFTPRPSTKGAQHRGVGLAVVKELLDGCQGRIICRSQSGSGTSFQIFLPLHAG